MDREPTLYVSSPTLYVECGVQTSTQDSNSTSYVDISTSNVGMRFTKLNQTEPPHYTWRISRCTWSSRIMQRQILIDDDKEYIPKAGMTFQTLEEAAAFYKEYAKRVGFSTKIRNINRCKETKEIKNQLITCNR
ncbi:hypothetical protein PIB30_055799 [Stylosanthes scabra]|uniref:FAR1 domain-containing protein n=1 Tax=Stylosanthes scabra TaxID=79078 RepID=A0ABU6RJG7_9FABA|nr:hypothetical protein [Stylosanthes scabra]